MVTRATPIRIVIVDDHAMVRRGMRDFLALHDDLEVVGEAADGLAALDVVAATRPDVVIMDLLMPALDGIEATRRLKATQPEVEIVALTSFIEEERIVSAIEAGADDLAAAIRAAAAGEVHLDPAVAGIVARRLRGATATRGRSPGAGGDTPGDRLTRLTARERDVLAAVARGLSNRAIADELGITERTARTHVSNILAKLGLTSRTQAALLAAEHGSGGR
jgi:DNA-binding NarL/FixJ family response regulator